MTIEEGTSDRIAGRLEAPKKGRRRSPSASNHLRLPVGLIDRFLGSFRPGTVTLLDSAHPYVFDMEAMLCVQAVGGLGGTVLYVDGGNRFDPYRLIIHARRQGMDRDLVLDHVQVARAFTAHQMTTLLVEGLGDEIGSRMPGKGPHAPDPSTGSVPPIVVVVANIMDLYLDRDVGGAEARGMLDLCTSRLVEISEQTPVISVVTSHGLSKISSRRTLKRMMYGRFHRVVRIERTLPPISRRGPDKGPAPGLPRYRNRSPGGRMFFHLPSEGRVMAFHPTPPYQRTLDDYFDTGVQGPGPEMDGNGSSTGIPGTTIEDGKEVL